MDLKHFYYEYFVVIFLLCASGCLCFFEDDYDETQSFGRCPWIRNKLKNGRVKIRSRGRIAKFLCDPGYELAGKRFATCVRGQWNNPIPACVARGCSRVPTVTNGRITEMYRGALLVYDCNPGYTLDGVVSIYCDGRRWSTDPPACVVTTSDPETTCDFEDPDLCGWNHDPTHDFDWKRNQFSTPSGHVGTGPSYDHTFGPGKGGFYLYLEASSPRKVNDTSRLFSPVYPPDYNGGCFIFWYHMYGATTGGLRVYIKLESHVFGEVHASWELYGDQGNEWRRGNIAIPALHESFQIVIEGIRGTSYVGDTAIDDVKLTKRDCESMENTTDTVATTVAESCRGRCREPDEASSCGCNENCYAMDNCCNDYATICTTGNETSVENPDEPIDDDLGKTSSPVTVTITKEDVSEHETRKAAVTTEFVSTTTKSTSEPSTKLVITLPPTDSTISGIVITSVKSPSSKPTTISSTSQVTSKATPFITTPSATTIKTTLKTSSVKPASSSTSTIPPTTSTTLSTTPSTTSKTMGARPSTASTIASTTPSTTTVLTTQSIYTTSTPATSLQNATSESTVQNSPFVLASSSPQQTTLSSLTTEITTISSTSSTRKTYNLRPRTTASTSPITPLQNSTVPTPTSSRSTSAIYSSPTNVTNTSSISYLSTAKSMVTFDTTKWHNTTLASISTTPSTTKSTQSSSTPSRTTTRTTTIVPLSTVLPMSSTQSRYGTQTAKSIIRPLKTTQKAVAQVTSEPLEKHASKLESTNDSSPPIVTIISIVIVVIICMTGGLMYYLRKQKSKRQSKLSDDSEMRFLADNESMEYSDPSVLDKILIK